jgi:hypothetical protein
MYNDATIFLERKREKFLNGSLVRKLISENAANSGKPKTADNCCHGNPELAEMGTDSSRASVETIHGASKSAGDTGGYDEERVHADTKVSDLCKNCAS